MGPFCIEENLNDTVYLDSLENRIITELAGIIPKYFQLHFDVEISIFQTFSK